MDLNRCRFQRGNVFYFKYTVHVGLQMLHMLIFRYFLLYFLSQIQKRARVNYINLLSGSQNHNSMKWLLWYSWFGPLPCSMALIWGKLFKLTNINVMNGTMESHWTDLPQVTVNVTDRLMRLTDTQNQTDRSTKQFYHV